MAKVIQVIESTVTRGEGVSYDPVRVVYQYWAFDGTLLAEADPCAPERWTATGDGKQTDAWWQIRKNHHVKRSA